MKARLEKVNIGGFQFAHGRVRLACAKVQCRNLRARPEIDSAGRSVENKHNLLSRLRFDHPNHIFIRAIKHMVCRKQPSIWRSVALTISKGRGNGR